MAAGARIFLACAALVMALAVVAGAFGAHALRASLDPAQLSTYRTAVEYHVYHGLGLLGVAYAADRLPSSRLVPWAGWLMLLGIVLFSGSLYAMSLLGLGLGIVTPFGGLAFIVAWILLGLGAIRAA